MIYFTLSETLRALLLFFLLGLFGGGVYEGVRFVFLNADLLPRVTVAAWRRALLRRGSTAEVAYTAGAERPLCGVRRFFCTFLFTLALGITFFLFLYYAFDGVFRFCFLLALLFAFWLFEGVAAPFLRRTERSVLSRLSALFYFALVLFFFPLALLFRLAGRYLLSPLAILISRIGARVRHALLLRRRLAAWRRALGGMRRLLFFLF